MMTVVRLLTGEAVAARAAIAARSGRAHPLRRGVSAAGFAAAQRDQFLDDFFGNREQPAISDLDGFGDSSQTLLCLVSGTWSSPFLVRTSTSLSTERHWSPCGCLRRVSASILVR